LGAALPGSGFAALDELRPETSEEFAKHVLDLRQLDGTLPLPVLLRRRRGAHVLDLTGAGVGDSVILALAKVLPTMSRSLEALLLADNRLTDVAIAPLCHALAGRAYDKGDKRAGKADPGEERKLALVGLADDAAGKADPPDDDADSAGASVTTMTAAVMASINPAGEAAPVESAVAGGTGARSSLVTLDLSRNDVDESSVDLRAFLLCECCVLRTLTLAAADVDDTECAALVGAVGQHRTLSKLDLSENLIGAGEALNAVQPDFVTGGEAIAQALLGNGTITDLDLSWNLIRLESATAVARSLALNTSLVTLNLSMNGFADGPAQHLGRALQTNTGLRDLNLAYNRVSAGAAVVIAHAMSCNCTLENLDLGGNPLGERGGAALVGALRRCQRPKRFLRISMAHADLGRQAAARELAFTPEKPGGDYDLDMAAPYDRAVIAELYRLASVSAGAKFERLSVCDVGSNVFKSVELRFERHTRPAAPQWVKASAALGRALDDSPPVKSGVHVAVRNLFIAVGAGPTKGCLAAVVSRLLGACAVRAASGVRKDVFEGAGGDERAREDAIELAFFALFDVVDADGSGIIDEAEMASALKLLGVLDASAHAAKHAIAVFDVDDTGIMERDEFVQWAMSAFLVGAGVAQHWLSDARTGSGWAVPQKGRVRCTFAASPRPPSKGLYCSDLGNRGLIANMAAASGLEREQLFDAAVASPDLFFTARQAQDIIEQCDLRLRLAQTVAKLLPAMASRGEALALLEKNLPLIERLKMREKMGHASFDAFCGNATGFYDLDLRDVADRRAALKLAEVNAAQCKNRKADTTQMQTDGSNLRNGFCGTEATILDPNHFPNAGRVRFDYVSTERPSSTDRALSSRRFQGLLILFAGNAALQKVDDAYAAMTRAEKRNSTFYIPADAQAKRLENFANREAPKRIAAAEARFAAAAADALAAAPAQKPQTPQRMPQPQTPKSPQRMPRPKSPKPTPTTPTPPATTPASAKLKAAARHIAKGRSLVAADDSLWMTHGASQTWLAQRSSCHRHVDWLGPERARRATVEPAAAQQQTLNPLSLARVPETASDRARFLDDLEANGARQEAEAMDLRAPAAYGVAYHALGLVRVATMSTWLTATQVQALVLCFPAADFVRAHVAVLLHARTFDLVNYAPVVLGALGAAEQAEVSHRIGWLNAGSPLHPDRGYSLDLRWPDHRFLTTLLAQLGKSEPGRNWTDATYRWAFVDDPIAGWELPSAWVEWPEKRRGSVVASEVLKAVAESKPDKQPRAVTPVTPTGSGPNKFGRLKFFYTSDAALGCKAVPEARARLLPYFLCDGPEAAAKGATAPAAPHENPM